MPQIFLITLSGEDRPGLTARIARTLAEHRAQVLDINQANIHESLLQGIMFRLPEDADGEAALLALDATAEQLELQLKVSPVSRDEYEQWEHAAGRPRYIVTIFARAITAQRFAAVSEIIVEQGLNIDVITRLSGRPPLHDFAELELPTNRAAVEVSVRGEARDADAMKESFLKLSRELDVDIAFQVDSVYRRSRRLVAFDMDSTLIQHEVINELAAEAGPDTAQRVAAITEAAMRGELDFDESLRQRVATLEGLEEPVMAKVARRLNLTEGAERLISNLKRFGYKTAIISGGFKYFGHHLQERLGIDYVAANELEIIDGRLTGRVVEPIVNARRKSELLESIAASEKIDLEQTIAVGDGANDLAMLRVAGLGIAFHAKPIVEASAEHKISTMGLDGILYLIGFRDRDLVPETTPIPQPEPMNPARVA